MICIRVVSDRTEADLIAATLQSAGIECRLRSDDAGGTMPHLTVSRGVEIRVSESDRERALQIIDAP